MWNSSYIKKIELRSGIIKAANSPDTRNMFAKLFGHEPQDDAKLIIDGIGYIRKILQNINIILPPVHLTDNSTIGINEFICYWEIETLFYSPVG